MRAALLVLAFSLALFLSSNICLAQTIELGYDDGGSDFLWSDFYPHGAAVKFTPPFSPWRITALKFYGLLVERRTTLTFNVELRDEDFELVCRTPIDAFKLMRNATLDWVMMKVANYTFDKEFYVCIYPMLTVDGPQLWIGADENAPISGESFLVDGERGVLVKAWDGGSERPRDFMIRVVGEPSVPEVEVRFLSATVTTDGATLNFLVKSNRKLISWDAVLHHGTSWTKCETQLEGDVITVKINEPGNVTVNILTSDASAGVTVSIGGDLWDRYFEAMDLAYKLRVTNSSLTSQLSDARNSIEVLNSSFSESQLHISILEGRFDSLLSEFATLNSRLASELEAHDEDVRALSREVAYWRALSLAFVIIALVSSFFLWRARRGKGPAK